MHVHRKQHSRATILPCRGNIYKFITILRATFVERSPELFVTVDSVAADRKYRDVSTFDLLFRKAAQFDEGIGRDTMNFSCVGDEFEI